MKVYVVTQGSYSDYHICAVLLEKSKAEAICKLLRSEWSEPNIEEYDTDVVEPLLNGNKLYDVELLKNGTAEAYEMSHPTDFIESINKVIKKRGREEYFVKVFAKDEAHALKVGIDKIHKYRWYKVDACQD